jgi:TRAP-type C4-dicarboxylate transport system permease small subunit
MDKKESLTSRFISEVRTGMEPQDVSDFLDWPGDTPRKIGWLERIEEALTMVFFIAMFLSVLAAVFWRYVLDDPLIWTVNAATIAFIWAVLIGSGLPNWTDEHIQFDLLYDAMPPGMQRGSRILGNLLIIVTFSMAIPATVDYLSFVADDSVTGLPLTFNWAYAVILWFLVTTVLHRARLLLRDVQAMATKIRQQ